MSHPIYRVTGFEIVGPHRLPVTFNDRTQQRIDVRPVLHGPMFGPLQELSTFNGVVLDPEAGTCAANTDTEAAKEPPMTPTKSITRRHFRSFIL